MSRGKVSKKNFNCGHRGFGLKCHRCEIAIRLQVFAEGKVKYTTNKKKDKKLQKIWTPAELAAESARLLEGTRRYLDV